MNNTDGTLIIEKLKPCKAEIRKEMAFMLEAMTELDKDVQAGKKAERRLKELEEEFLRLCKYELGEE